MGRLIEGYREKLKITVAKVFIRASVVQPGLGCGPVEPETRVQIPAEALKPINPNNGKAMICSRKGDQLLGILNFPLCFYPLH